MTMFEALYLIIALLSLIIQILATADQIRNHKRH